MLNVLLYTTEPVLVLGVGSAFGGTDCRLAAICDTVPALLMSLARVRYGILLIDVTADLNIGMLSEIKDQAHGSPIVIWVDKVSTEFVGQAINLGVKGILRKSLSLELQVRCLEKVGSGDLWVEKALVASLLSSRRIVLTWREQQLVRLLVQGLKNKEIAFRLGLSEGSVKVYFSHLFQKVGVTDRFELALYAIQHVFGGRNMPMDAEIAPRVYPTGPIPGALALNAANDPRNFEARPSRPQIIVYSQQ